MITHKILLDYLKGLITDKLKAAEQTQTLDLDFSDEFNYNSKAHCLFVLKVLSGAITSGNITLPIQLMGEIESNYVREVIDVLNELAIENNEKTINLGDDLHAKVFFRTPSVIGTFQNKGLNDMTAIAMDISLLITIGSVTFSDVYLRIYNPNTDEMEDMTNMLDLTYANRHIKDARTIGSNPNQKNYTNAIQKEITVDYIIDATSALHQMLADDVDSDKIYKVEYYNGVYERVYNMTILSYDEIHILGDIAKAKLALTQASKFVGE